MIIIIVIIISLIIVLISKMINDAEIASDLEQELYDSMQEKLIRKGEKKWKERNMRSGLLGTE